MEKAGKPTVGLVAAGFERDAAATARVFGLPQFRYAHVREVITGLTPEQIEREVTDAYSEIVDALTTNAEEKGAGSDPRKVRPAERLTIEARGEYAAVEAMNRQFLEREWSDGFPLIP